MDKNVEDIIIEKLLNKFPIEEEVEFNEFNIQEKLKNNAFLSLQYNHHLTRERIELEKIEHELLKITGERYHYYRFEYDEELSKTEIEKYYLPRDPEVNKIKVKIRNQKTITGFFESAVNALDNQKWNIKNFIETLRTGF